jgi:hypothetical protein
MSTRLRRTRGSCRRAVAVEFALHGREGGDEAFIERVRRDGECVEIAVLLADGSDAAARLDHSDWEWLELRAGDIVPVRVLSE